MTRNPTEALRVSLLKMDPGHRRALDQSLGRATTCETCALCEPSSTPWSRDEPTATRPLRTGIRRLPPKAQIYLEGDSPDEIFAPLAGWAFRYRILFDGKRQIHDFVLPGDLLGLPLNESLERMDHSVEAITDVALCTFQARSLREQILSNTELASRVASVKAGQTSRAYERLTSLGRRTAQQRMAQLILELFTRLGLQSAVDGATCEFPLTQNLLADALGLSTVHVNRVIRKFREEKLVTVGCGMLTIHDPEGLEEICDFDATYLIPHATFCGAGRSEDRQAG